MTERETRERINDARRLAFALYERSEDAACIAQLARILHFGKHRGIQTGKRLAVFLLYQLPVYAANARAARIQTCSRPQ